MAGQLADTENVRLVIPFWGDRPYLQAAAIFDEILHHVSDATDIRFTMRRLVGQPIMLTRNSPNSDPIGEFSCRLAGQSRRYLIQTDPFAPAPARVPYDEAAVTADAVIEEGTTIRMPLKTGVTFLQLAIAMTKRLIEE